MRRPAKLATLAIAACAFLTAAYVLITGIRGSASTGYAANIQAATQLPAYMQKIELEGTVRYAVVTGTRGRTYFVASHISESALDLFCKDHGIDRLTLGPETPPAPDVMLQEDDRLDKKTFSFQCAGPYQIYEGASRTMPTIWIRLCYCPETKFITMRLTES